MEVIWLQMFIMSFCSTCKFAGSEEEGVLLAAVAGDGHEQEVAVAGLAAGGGGGVHHHDEDQAEGEDQPAQQLLFGEGGRMFAVVDVASEFTFSRTCRGGERRGGHGGRHRGGRVDRTRRLTCCCKTSSATVCIYASQA